MMEEEGPNHANLTDPGAGLLKSREGGFITGYNAQSMVAPISSDDASGMINTAANVTSSSDDHPTSAVADGSIIATRRTYPVYRSSHATYLTSSHSLCTP